MQAWSCSLSGVEPVAPRRPHFHRHEAACFLTGKPVTALLRAPKSSKYLLDTYRWFISHSLFLFV